MIPKWIIRAHQDNLDLAGITVDKTNTDQTTIYAEILNLMVMRYKLEVMNLPDTSTIKDDPSSASQTRKKAVQHLNEAIHMLYMTLARLTLATPKSQ